ncbi:MAG: pyridoxamine 5'-phosphate oxidase family protein [candidate division Zixibacteria bacterium]|nr:pyridoxamine 5'-phosphate oxidase family protein [candidate division Zixibacteria bacterium]
MSKFDEPAFEDYLNEDDSEAYDDIEVGKKIAELANEQLYGVLSTQTEGQPYGSMIGFAFTDDLKYAVFATPKATRKYHNLIKCKNVALVVNDRDKYPDDLMKIGAFTATGKADEINGPKIDSNWTMILLKKHPYLRDFLKSSTTALFRIKIIRFFYVSSFQEVREWKP